MEHLVPSVYHDPREVVWKHLVAQAYWDILDTLRADAAGIDEVEPLRFAFLKAFNGQHDIEGLCGQVEPLAAQLVAMLRASGRDDASAKVAQLIDGARDAAQRAMRGLQGLRHVDRGASYVAGGTIVIAGMPAETFAANPDYVNATLQLVGEVSPESAALARASWNRGFTLPAALVDHVRAAADRRWAAEDLLADVLLHEQRSGRYSTLRECDFVPTRAPADNRNAKLRAIEQGWYLLGRLMSCTALFNEGGALLGEHIVGQTCPVRATLLQAGIVLDPAQLNAFRRFLLVRSTHGLNPGEFAARIAASVRTSFPQALLAGLMVRAGNLHGGALRECMRLIDAYLATPDRDGFVRRCLEAGELYGFGHRIHKASVAAEAGPAGGDPRVSYLVAAARDAFPDMRSMIDALEAFASRVRAAKPNLAPNNDFSAAVWFRCLGLVPEVGTAFFTMARLPGMIAQVVNQLDIKGNALRPPLAVNLPYAP